MEEQGATTKSKVIPKLARHAAENNNVQAYLGFCQTIQKQVDEQIKKMQGKETNENKESQQNSISMFSEDVLKEYGLDSRKEINEKGRDDF